MEPLCVIADDLTGACDVGAALLPWPDAVVVDVGTGDPARPPAPGLYVRNTQSRTLPAPRAAKAVTTVLRTLPRPWTGILVKKIDTGLRGSLGAELDAAIEAVGADEAFVLPAIPDTGRTTVGGIQRIDGVPVDQTAFATDPENPVRDARVGAAIEVTSRRRTGVLELTDVRRGAVAAAVDRLRAARAQVIVCDAETEQDLERTLQVLAARARPLVLAGSTGLAHALRRVLGAPEEGASLGDRAPAPATHGVLVVVGSAHPVARVQLARAEALAGLRVIVVAKDADVSGAATAAAAAIAAGGNVALVTPNERAKAGAVLPVAAAAERALSETRPAGLVLVGGETAFRTLVAMGVRWVAIDAAPAPLCVRGHVASGVRAGLAVVTKGGSSGPPERLADLVRELTA